MNCSSNELILKACSRLTFCESASAAYAAVNSDCALVRAALSAAALASAAAMAHVKDYRVVNYPAPVDKFELFLQKFKGANASAIAKSYMQEQMSTEFIWLKKIQQLKQIQGKAQMLMPFQLTIQ